MEHGQANCQQHWEITGPCRRSCNTGGSRLAIVMAATLETEASSLLISFMSLALAIRSLTTDWHTPGPWASANLQPLKGDSGW